VQDPTHFIKMMYNKYSEVPSLWLYL